MSSGNRSPRTAHMSNRGCSGSTAGRHLRGLLKLRPATLHSALQKLRNDPGCKTGSNPVGNTRKHASQTCGAKHRQRDEA